MQHSGRSLAGELWSHACRRLTARGLTIVTCTLSIVSSAMLVPLWPRLEIIPVDSTFTVVGHGTQARLTIVVAIHNYGAGPVRLIGPCQVSSLAALERLNPQAQDQWDTVYVPARVMRLDPPCTIAPGAMHVDTARIRVAADPAFRLPVEHIRGTYRTVYSIAAVRDLLLPDSLRRSAPFHVERE